MTIESYLEARGGTHYQAADGDRIYLPVGVVMHLIDFWVPKWSDDESARWFGGDIPTDRISAWTQSIRCAKVFWDVDRQRWAVRYASGPWVDRLWDRLLRIKKMIDLSNDESKVALVREGGDLELEFLIPGGSGHAWKRLKGDPIKDLVA
ncbi:MAG: hypothetical protein WCZ86_06150 [Desulfurivibrionaceae bacterium]